MSFKEKVQAWLSSPKISPFVPKFIDCFVEGYSRQLLVSDILAGITVGVISLPLAMAFSIGAGLDPERGLYTAIVAGLLTSIFGGSRFLIGGPTGAYIILIFGILQRFGYEGLVCASIQASILLFLLGALKCGGLIRFISYPVIVGFTSGLAIVLVSTQINDFFGLKIPHPTVDIVDRFSSAVQYSSTINYYALGIALATLFLIILFRRISKKIPGVIVALCAVTAVAYFFQLPVETIESKFGIIPRTLPSPHWPAFSFELIRKTFPDAVGIALLGAIESLLACVIADSFAGTRHKSNCELIGQGIANFGSAVCGGIPSTGAIARTTASMQLHAKTPLAGIIHAFTLLVLMLVLAPWASMVPLAALAAVLVIVSWGMFEVKQLKEVLKGGRGESLVLLATLAITILVDINTAVQTGVFLSIILFLKRSSESTTGKLLEAIENDELIPDKTEDLNGPWKAVLPDNVKVYEIEGPFFFAVSDLLADVLNRFDTLPSTLIVRMRSVPFIDSTAVNSLQRFARECKARNVELFLAELKPNVRSYLKHADFFKTFPKDHVIASVDQILRPSNEAISDLKTTLPIG
jgi:sulfate permease, SulP family